MEAILKNWSFLRVVRVALGLFILVQGIVNSDTLSILLGAVFAGMAVFNVGCCGTGGCGISQDKHETTANKEVSFEEIKSEN
ncbi:hypothetical protein [Aurantibacillus circumpalustris]|uniref:hypothetical protein n=1 Tax=Aurantibacillus circumpalustris TaxID=3036359 RepID=UPI00295C1334|nr:hypothetical protein [Aurantibacillus circumpalustris]